MVLLLMGAHPRLRGADWLVAHFGLSFRGSSPLTRGGLLVFAIGRCRAGLIPAYAGRTRFLVYLLAPRAAHPRLRGADQLYREVRARIEGSSPLTRGGRCICG